MSPHDLPDRIFLEGIEVYAYGGVSEEERRLGQRYSLDLNVEFDTRAAGASDSVTDTVSYTKLHEIAVNVMQTGTFNLIESRAELVAMSVLANTRVASVTVRLRKVVPPIAGVVAAAGVEITRRR